MQRRQPIRCAIAEYESAWVSGEAFGTAEDQKIAVTLTRTIPNNNGDPYHYVAYSRDGGETWGDFRRTEIPCAYNRSAIGQLPDGRVYIIGSLAPAQSGHRRPLCIVVSDDGVHFSKVYRLLDDKIHTLRNDVVYDGFIWVACAHGGNNSGRGEVSVVKIPIQNL